MISKCAHPAENLDIPGIPVLKPILFYILYVCMYLLGYEKTDGMRKNNIF